MKKALKSLMPCQCRKMLYRKMFALLLKNSKFRSKCHNSGTNPLTIHQVICSFAHPDRFLNPARHGDPLCFYFCTVQSVVEEAGSSQDKGPTLITKQQEMEELASKRRYMSRIRPGSAALETLNLGWHWEPLIIIRWIGSSWHQLVWLDVYPV